MPLILGAAAQVEMVSIFHVSALELEFRRVSFKIGTVEAITF